MTASDALRSFVGDVLGPGWRIQFGRWVDGAGRFAVIKPAGGLPAELVRRPQFTLTLIGQGPDDMAVASEAADSLVEATRTSAGSLVFIEAGEPAYFPTNDGRPVFEIAVSAITN